MTRNHIGPLSETAQTITESNDSKPGYDPDHTFNSTSFMACDVGKMVTGQSPRPSSHSSIYHFVKGGFFFSVQVQESIIYFV